MLRIIIVVGGPSWSDRVNSSARFRLFGTRLCEKSWSQGEEPSRRRSGRASPGSRRAATGSCQMAFSSKMGPKSMPPSSSKGESETMVFTEPDDQTWCKPRPSPSAMVLIELFDVTRLWRVIASESFRCSRCSSSTLGASDASRASLVLERWRRSWSPGHRSSRSRLIKLFRRSSCPSSHSSSHDVLFVSTASADMALCHEPAHAIRWLEAASSSA
mmetsp:Transcript_69747/g.182888  ORF Transcript_69747/g.182888 Transcript_69747/m.182888 type:complete len:216 (-) Transcript_69747:148-795(-)